MLSGMIEIELPKGLLLDQSIPTAAKWTYCYLCCRPGRPRSISEIARDMGVDRHTARTALRCLFAAGYIDADNQLPIVTDCNRLQPIVTDCNRL